MTQEVLKLSQEALAGLKDVENQVRELVAENKALKEALAQTQEPVAYLCENAVGHKYFRWKKPSSTYKPIALYTTPPQRTEQCNYPDCKCPTENPCLKKLAQPVQEPVAWQTMEAKYPTLEKLDIRMGDGSILCSVWPQSDGDLWWEGSGTGEKFIDPKYANVTHWRVHSDTTPPQRTEQPKVRTGDCLLAGVCASEGHKIQPQRTWQGLTDEEIAQGCKESWVTEQAWQSAVWWAEDKLKERNT
jgi:hypothetical protein